MSATTIKLPPIFRLDIDVFIKILEFNGNMFAENEDEDDENKNKDALTTTRFTSQVCRIWRHVTLKTPFLWARLIDLDRLQGPQSIQWAKELIRRSKDSPLWIRNGSTNSSRSTLSRDQRVFFCGVLDQNWDRVQRLVLKGPILDDIDISGGPLYRPTPKLKMLDIQFSGNRKTRDGAKKRRSPALFSNNAPLLTHFSANYRKVTPDVPWLHNLTSLKLDDTYSVFECIMVLSATPALEYLEISHFDTLSNHSHCLVSLPKLKHMKLTLEFEDMTLLLDHLTIPSECSLNLIAYQERGSLLSVTPRVETALSRVLRPYFKSHPPKLIAINCPAKGPVTVCDDFNSENNVFELWCHSLEDYPVRQSIHCILDLLSYPEYSSATQLFLRCDDIFTACGLSFLQSFTSVKVLHTNQEIFRHITTTEDTLFMIQRRREILLPKLHTVDLRSPSGSPFDVCSASGHTVDFIFSRIIDGHPISVLDITDCHERSIDHGAIEYLEKNTDLVIISRPSRAAPCFMYYP